jgi:hypothetical protein
MQLVLLQLGANKHTCEDNTSGNDTNGIQAASALWCVDEVGLCTSNQVDP